jgi:hypothetical protein
VRRAADHVEDHCVQHGVGQCWNNAVLNSIFLALFALPLWAIRRGRKVTAYAQAHQATGTSAGRK